MRAVDLATRATGTCHHHQLLMPWIIAPLHTNTLPDGARSRSPDSGSGSRAVGQDSAGKAQPNGLRQTAQLVKHLG
jgi:hypothetical protein